MARNLVNGTNITIEENGDNINMNLSSTYTNNLEQEINDSFKKNNIYSTTEIVVGKWINNKPIYRKVLTGKFNSNAQTIEFSYETLIDVRGKIFSSGGDVNDINFYTASNNFCYVYGVSTGLQFTSSSASGKNYYIIVEYTKTTD